MGNTFSYTLRCIVVGIALLVSPCLNVYAQKADTSVSDTIAKKVERIDSISKMAIATEQVAYTDSAWKADSLKMMTEEIKTPKQIVAATDTTKHRRDWATWKPDPKRAMWLALVLPGAGQIYNRKYWKLPIIYGGFVGCAYAMRWNNMMYHDYSQAYLDIMDDDPTTESYNQFLHLGNKITPENMERWKDIFKKRKDRYRRWRDMSFFCMLGVYAFSVIDAYVDASLSEFDISHDLSMRVSPAVISSKTDFTGSRHTSLGVSCSLNF